MRDPGRIAAAIDLLGRFAERPQPVSVLVADWARGARYAGSKDRAFVRGLVLDALRRWKSFGADTDPRRGVFLTLRDVWGWPESRIEEAFGGDFGPGALTAEEKEAAPSDVLDLPDFLIELLGESARAISDDAAERAPVDLRVNVLKADRPKALKALATLDAEETALSPLGLRIARLDATDKGPGVSVIPAYGKGWVEVQDEGSQLTVLACGPLGGRQVLDYCAGGGGKTLALAGSMANAGQLFAYDRDAHRLAPIHERVRRAGVRNLQVIAPNEAERLSALEGKIDLVFVDAPCSGSGTWRRHPDTKWRLTEAHLEARMAEQDQVLREAARFVAPGGSLVYVTCSFLRQENEDRVAAFLAEQSAFTVIPPLGCAESDLAEKLAPFVEGQALRLSPGRSGTDGFTLMKLERAA
ncbi:MAG: RsmB/NOP family class I SAM-dependent RNA methyltransferase [Parvularcula sp.]|nr:RsmB/NOP family class I SAM-dependent RNA methyltransferase [Parvularcula sp.]